MLPATLAIIESGTAKKAMCWALPASWLPKNPLRHRLALTRVAIEYEIPIGDTTGMGRLHCSATVNTG